MSRKLNFPRIVAAITLPIIAFGAAVAAPKSDNYIRHRIVRLYSEHGMCSGEQIRTPSGKDLIISAAHCLPLADQNGIFHVKDEDGALYDRKLIAEDMHSDLIVLEGLPHLHGLRIGKHSERFEHVRTFSHGANMDTYTTEGVIVQDLKVQVALGLALMPEEQKACLSKPKNSLGYIMGIFPVCVLDVIETVMTAKIVPGSSGGATVNDRGDLIGVNSASDGNQFSMIVTLGDIQRFLSDK